MSRGSAVATACYVYGIVPAATSLAPLAEVATLSGAEGGQVRLLVQDDLAALVEPVDHDRQLGRRRDLVAHSQVLDALALHGPVLPLRFGSVVDDERDVADQLLLGQQDHLLALLAEVTGRVQLMVRARYELDALLADVVRAEPEVARLREATVGVDEDASHYDRLRLGELVAQAVDRRRQVDGAQILDGLLPHAERHVVRETSGLDGLLDVALLVRTEQQSDLEAAAEALAATYHGSARLSLVGPTAAYDFVPEQ